MYCIKEAADLKRGDKLRTALTTETVDRVSGLDPTNKFQLAATVVLFDNGVHLEYPPGTLVAIVD